MISLNIEKTFGFISKASVAAYEAQVKAAQEALENGTGKGNDFLGWLHLPSSISQEHLADLKATAQVLRDNCEVVIVAGIGGSYLGARAVIEALSNSFTWLQEKKTAPVMIYAGHNISEDYLYELTEFLKDKKFGVINISKSGTTTETALAFRLLKKQCEDQRGKEMAKKVIVAITDAKKGAARITADKEGYKSFIIPDNVGGRFSVLTPVGLLPIAIAGFDIEKLVAGAADMEKACGVNVPFAENLAAQYAATRNELYKNGKKIEILVNFCPKLHYVSEWWKQLYGESEGKENKGIFPAAVDFSTDLHSMGQWIQEGERTIFETVISVENVNHKLEVPSDEANLDGLNFLAGKRVDEVNKMAGKFVVICAGYRAEMEEFVNNANPGFRRRFSNFLHIEDYSADQLICIYRSLIRKKGNILTPDAEEMLIKLVDEMVTSKDENFGNAGEMVKLFEKTKARRANRLAQLHAGGQTLTREMYLTIEAEDIPYDPPKMIDEEECMAELNQLIGLSSVKREVKEIADYIKVERAKAEAMGKKFQGVVDHYLFVGNPGTGKTTVARIMGNIFYSLGVLPSNRLLEVTRKDLVEGYVGQTATKTARVVKRAVGGVFFIDEAYSLMGDNFGQEATNTILPMLLDYKGKMVCIAAGYPREIRQWIDTNSGLESRFTKVIHFEDYNPDELAQIFRMKVKKDKLTLTPEAENAMRVYFTDLYNRRERNFANAREVNNYFDRVKKNQSSRLRHEMERPDFDPASYSILLPEDMG